MFNIFLEKDVFTTRIGVKCGFFILLFLIEWETGVGFAPYFVETDTERDVNTVLALIKKIAQYLVKNWDKLAEWIKKAIISIAGSAIVDAIIRGVEAVISYLSSLPSTVIEYIAKLLGL